MILRFIIGLLVLGILVFVHELGHYLFAKWRKVKVLAFSIGFGKPILRKKIGETEYRISIIPFGGYVKMAGENPEEVTGKEFEFHSKKAWERILIAFAGPFFNILFGILALIIAYTLGVDEVPKGDLFVGYVTDSTLSSKVLPGDRIVAINDVKVDSWERISEEVMLAKDDSVYLVIQKQKTKKLDTIKVRLLKDIDKIQHMEYKYLPIFPPVDVTILSVLDTMPAAKAGLKSGDIIKFLDGKNIYSTKQFISLMQNVKDSVIITVTRNDSLLNFKVLPDFGSGRPLLGVTLYDKFLIKISYPLPKAIYKAIEKSMDITLSTFRVLGKLFTGAVKLNNLSGPVGIAEVTGQVATFGLSALLFLIALISINLAIFNLLPLAITDGGLILFFLIEIIRGKPIPLKIQLIIQQIFAYILIGFAILVTFFDIKRLNYTPENSVKKEQSISSTTSNSINNDSLNKIINKK